MATQDNNPGLLSKVAKFVRNPTTDWSDLNKPEVPSENEHGKQALKHMIERKRHNDSVRRREFDQLRKLRQTSTAIKTELDQGPLAFRNSTGYSDLDERATTLKKIDEIEAQMSRQWWKSRQTSSTPAASVGNANDSIDKRPHDSGGHSDNHTLFASTQSSVLAHDQQDAPTLMGASLGPEPQPPGPGATQASDSSLGFEVSASSVFSDSKMMSVDMGESLSDPEMEEAAIRFANGDDSGAQAVLMAALTTPNVTPEVADGWAAALFDLYRGTGQQANFEQFSMDYAQRFGKSAPAWFSTPQRLGLECPLPAAHTAANTPQTTPSMWECPLELDDQAIARLQALVKDQGITYRLNWQNLQHIAPTAAPLLSDLFALWCDQALTLCFEGADGLLLLLQAYTPMGDNTVPASWWQLRLNTMRLLHLPDEFELAAIDFCITYELSPPSWVTPRCTHVDLFSIGAQAMPMGSAAGQPSGTTRAPRSPTEEPDLLAPGARADLSLVLVGDVLGDSEQAMTALQATTIGQDVCRVSCADLIRVDFSAAGSLLNWVAHVEANGGRIEFRDVPRLVAAFFNLIGINEHARVNTRTN